jgi:predicted deacylase
MKSAHFDEGRTRAGTTRRTGIGDLRPAPGQRAHGFVRIPGIEPAWEMPAWVVRGAEDGPTLAVTAGVHAAEYPPIAAATRFARGLDPASLRGAVMVVSLVNRPGFFQRSLYVNPVDGRNLNRCFPGRPDGAPAERVADFLMREVIAGADAYVDLHCGDLVEALVPFGGYRLTGDDELDERSRRLVDAFGLPHVVARPKDDATGTAYAAAALAGVPAALAEIGQQGVFEEASVAGHLAGLRNVLALMGMVQDEYVAPPPPRRHGRSAWARATADAMWLPAVACGDEVVEGQDVGELLDVFGEPIERVTAPASGPVIFLVTSLAVPEGGPLMGVATA